MGFSRTRSNREQYKDCSECGTTIDVDDGFLDIDGDFHCEACKDEVDGEIVFDDIWLD